MKKTLSILLSAALALNLTAAPSRAEMSDGEKAAAALAVIGITALALKNSKDNKGFKPANAREREEYDRGYRDGQEGLRYWPNARTRAYGIGYQEGQKNRDKYADEDRYGNGAPERANSGCAQIVARNFAVSPRRVELLRARSLSRHKWLIEAAVGRDHMVCTMRDNGEVLDLRGGRM